MKRALILLAILLAYAAGSTEASRPTAQHDPESLTIQGQMAPKPVIHFKGACPICNTPTPDEVPLIEIFGPPQPPGDLVFHPQHLEASVYLRHACGNVYGVRETKP